MSTAYVKHPFSTEEKKELRRKFDKVLDVRFVPSQLEKVDVDFTKKAAKQAEKVEEKTEETQEQTPAA